MSRRGIEQIQAWMIWQNYDIWLISAIHILMVQKENKRLCWLFLQWCGAPETDNQNMIIGCIQMKGNITSLAYG